MHDSVPNVRYSSVCNVLRQWSISLIPTYRVYRLYDIAMLCSEVTASFACLECHQLHLSPKRRIPKESTEGWKDVDSRDFN